MKKWLLFFSHGLIFCSASADIQFFSEKAQELVKEYAPYATPMAKLPFSHPPHNKEKHYNEEYRPAWEELYLVCLTNEQNRSINKISINGVILALSEISSTNSIPMFVDAYTRLFDTNNDVNLKHQQEIIKILLRIDASEAMDAVFSLLDITEVRLGTKASVSLYEIIINDLEQAKRLQEWKEEFIKSTPNATVSERSLKESEVTKKRQERFNTYQNINLSERNQNFLKQVQSLTGTQEKQNSD